MKNDFKQLSFTYISASVCACVCVCVLACVRACMCGVCVGVNVAPSRVYTVVAK